MKYHLLLVELFFVVLNQIDNVVTDAPNFVSGCGLTVRSVAQLNPQLYEVVVSSEEVRGDKGIRILVPPDYTTSGSSRRYPALYLLHGASDNETAWTVKATGQSICGNESLITVMPSGDPYEYYTNWIIEGDVAPQHWIVFHMEQLVPWIDINLRTVAKKEGRAIGGISMGGYGAIHYAELYSDNFIYGASFSGTLDLLDKSVQDVIVELPGPTKPLIGPFGYPSTEHVGWNGWFTENTLTRAVQLRNITIALYTGSVGFTEHYLRFGTYRLWNLLSSLRIPVYFDDYGDGKSIGHGCEGTHTFPCWNAALIDVLPRIMAVLQQQY